MYTVLVEKVSIKLYKFCIKKIKYWLKLKSFYLWSQYVICKSYISLKTTGFWIFETWILDTKYIVSTI